jgi:phosphoribosyl-ATP pyrophosphohydrolase
MTEQLKQLEILIRERRGSDPALSYVSKLFHAGRAKIAQKLGEEAIETVIAALGDNRQDLISESADLLFHLMVLLGDSGVTLADIEAELLRREGVSGLAEKAARVG